MKWFIKNRGRDTHRISGETGREGRVGAVETGVVDGVVEFVNWRPRTVSGPVCPQSVFTSHSSECSLPPYWMENGCSRERDLSDTDWRTEKGSRRVKNGSIPVSSEELDFT